MSPMSMLRQGFCPWTISLSPRESFVLGLSPRETSFHVSLMSTQLHARHTPPSYILAYFSDVIHRTTLDLDAPGSYNDLTSLLDIHRPHVWRLGSDASLTFDITFRASVHSLRPHVSHLTTFRASGSDVSAGYFDLAPRASESYAPSTTSTSRLALRGVTPPQATSTTFRVPSRTTSTRLTPWRMTPPRVTSTSRCAQPRDPSIPPGATRIGYLPSRDYLVDQQRTPGCPDDQGLQLNAFQGSWPSRVFSGLMVLKSISRKFRSHGLRECSLASWSWNPSLVKVQVSGPSRVFSDLMVLESISRKSSGLRAFESFLWPHGLELHLSYKSNVFHTFQVSGP